MPSEMSRRAAGPGVAVGTSVNGAHQSLSSPTSLSKSTKHAASSDHSKKRKRSKAKSEEIPDVATELVLASEYPAKVEKMKGDEGNVQVEEKEGWRGSKRQRKKEKKKQKAALSRSNTTESLPPTAGARPSLTPTTPNTILPAHPTALRAKNPGPDSVEDEMFSKYMDIKAERSHTKSTSPFKDVSAGMESVREKEKMKAERNRWKEKEAALRALHKAVEDSRDEARKEAEALQGKIKELEEAAEKEKQAAKARDEVSSFCNGRSITHG